MDEEELDTRESEEKSINAFSKICRFLELEEEEEEREGDDLMGVVWA